MAETDTVHQEQIERQLHYIDLISQISNTYEKENGRRPRAYTKTFGCQQNEADTEQIVGMLHDMGYEKANDADEAQVIIINTCAIREHAEARALGNVGALLHLKKKHPELTIGLCGCMVQQAHMADKIRNSYPQVNLLFGTYALWRFPELLYRRLCGEKRVFDISDNSHASVAEGLPIKRAAGPHAWLSIMYGCNNFCTYCIVPYVRGRERSRHPQEIEKELRELIHAGYKDITLLGQNVNSYGKDLGLGIDFSDLLYRLNKIDGDFLLRFMTSHPKDASEKLFDTMASCKKVAKQLHLPFQSGSDEILKRMNRGYTSSKYNNLIAYARMKMPEITISSDIIVGFPGETENDFQQTLSVVSNIGFDMLYTFLYSKRNGTPAAAYEDSTTHEEKQDRFARLLQLQDTCVAPRQAAYFGRQIRVLIDGTSKNSQYPYTARTEGGILVCCAGDHLTVGEFASVIIDKTSLRCLFAREITE